MSQEVTMRGVAVFIMLFMLNICLQTRGFGSDRLQSFKTHKSLKNNSIFKNLKWQSIGPRFQGGRVTDIEVYQDNQNKILLATASGGIWLTTDSGKNWKPVFDDQSTLKEMGQGATARNGT